MPDDPSMPHDITGIPIESLIGAPVRATAMAEVYSAQATADFINAVAFNRDEQGNITNTVRTVNFAFERPVQDEKTGEVLSETVSVQLPLLAMVSIPNLRIDYLDVTFDIEVTQTVPTTTETPEQASQPNLSPSIQVLGKVTTPSNHVRSSDYASRYHVELHAADGGPSEALLRILDLMAHGVAPSSITRHRVVDQSASSPTSEPPPAGEPA